MPIKPGVPAPNLAPRMGEDDLSARGGVTYRELRSRSLLNRCVSPRMPFTWTVNPYRGCAMGCRYCYATYTHEFMGITTPERSTPSCTSRRARYRRPRGGSPSP
jgi:hypothetical protein